MEYRWVSLTRDGVIGILTITRPEALNALNRDLLTEIDAAVEEVGQNDAVKVVVITGAGKAFVAGADIAEMSKLDPLQAKAFGAFGGKVFRKIEQLNKPVIAAVNGFALGGGCELAMSADIRVASTKAKFGQPEVGLGIIPGFAGTQRLPRLVGVAKAKELIFSGNMINAEEALAIGLVNQVQEPDQLMEAALTLAKKIAAQSVSAVAMAKTAINRGVDLDIEAGMELESDLFGLCFSCGDQKEGMGAFLEKRKPAFGK